MYQKVHLLLDYSGVVALEGGEWCFSCLVLHKLNHENRHGQRTEIVTATNP